LRAEIERSLIQGEVKAPQSKSFAIRLAFLSLLTEVKTNFWESEDIKMALGAVNALKRGEGYIYVGGSATTLRMLIPIALALKRRVTIDGDETLRKRPISAIVKALKRASFSSNTLPVTVYGELEEETVIEGNESSQYVSGLILAYALLGRGRIVVLPPISSKSYILMTIDLVNKLGGKVKMEGNVIEVEAGKLKPFEGEVPGDYLLASFYGIASLITSGKLVIYNLYEPPKYFGDHSILDVLRNMGARSFYQDGKWVLEGSGSYSPIDLELDDSPDMAPSVAALASVANGVSVLRKVERLRIKESDRVSTIIEGLRAFGVEAYYAEGSIYIRGANPRRGYVLCPNDHRIAMMAADIATRSGGVIEGAECVKKSNPYFWDDLRALGGKVRLS
jgi:3-phosphoshikimate 1-carboxyvinyltransferase